MTFLSHLPPFALDLIRLSLWLIALMAIFVPLERLFGLRRQLVFRQAFATDLIYYFVSGIVPKMLLAIPLSLAAVIFHRVVPSAYYAAIGVLPGAVRLAAALFIGEIGAYWGHRLSHEIPCLWRFHAVHHGAEEVDWLVHTRAHPGDMVFTRLCGLLPLYALGFVQPTGAGADLTILWLTVIGTVWGFFVHANVNWRLGPLELLVSTPAFHHWHHANDGAEYINKNYSPLFPWVDRIFGTFFLPGTFPGKYGIDTPLPSEISLQLLEPFLPARRAAPPSVRAQET